jgi:hypothetical protein
VSLPETIAIVLGAFAPMFSTSLFAHVPLLMVGATLAPGNRPVRSVRRVMGQADARHFQHDHRVLRRVRWPALHGGCLLRRWV